MYGVGSTSCPCARRRPVPLRAESAPEPPRSALPSPPPPRGPQDLIFRTPRTKVQIPDNFQAESWSETDSLRRADQLGQILSLRRQLGATIYRVGELILQKPDVANISLEFRAFSLPPLHSSRRAVQFSPILGPVPRQRAERRAKM